MAIVANVDAVNQDPADKDERFFLLAAAIRVAVIIAGFTNLFLRGISTFAAPWPVHLHAVTFMRWVGFFMPQGWLACRGRVELHQRLGWIGVALVCSS